MNGSTQKRWTRRVKLRFAPFIAALMAAFAILVTDNQVEASREAPTVSTGWGHTMAVRNDGSLWAWGSNMVGQLGDGTITSRHNPVRVMDNVVAVSAGFDYTMAIRSDGSLWAWGLNESGQLGDGTTTERHSPVRVMDNVIAVSASLSHTMAIRNDGSLWAWGSNGVGRLGDGTTTNRHSPVHIMNNVIAVSAAPNHTMAIRSDGSLWAWGNNGSGQLGDTIANQRTPVRIMDNVTAVSAGFDYAMAIRTNGSLWAWGNNSVGRLGDGTTINRHSPVHIIDNVVAVSAGSNHTMAIRTDGSLWAWGSNGVGRLGDGTTTERHSPVHIMNNVIAVYAGINHTMAIRSDGSLWAWGWNSHGQLGDGTTTNRHSPVRIMDNVKIPENLGRDTRNNPSPWARDDINRARDLELLPAALDGRFQQNITRAEFCLLAVQLFEAKGGSYPIRFPISFHATPSPFEQVRRLNNNLSMFDDPNVLNFTDVGSLSTDKQVAVLKMASVGVVSGIGGNRFNPNGIVTRQEAAVMLGRLMERLGYRFQPTVASFRDINTAAQWARGHIANMEVSEIMIGSGGLFRPLERFTREQAVSTIMRIFNRMSRIPPEGGVFFPRFGSPSIYLPRENAENQFNSFSNFEFMPELREFVLKYISGEILKATLEARFGIAGYALGPASKLLLGFKTAIDIGTFAAEALITPYLMTSYQIALNDVVEDGFLVTTFQIRPGAQIVHRRAYNSNEIELDGGRFVAMSQLAEDDIRILSRYSGALEIILWSDITLE